METQIPSRTLSRPLIWLILLGVLGAVLISIVPLAISLWVWQELIIFATVFLGIFIEAVPFLLLGTLASGLVEVFISQDWITRISLQRTLPAALLGSILGLVFPVCECGVIPLTRRLFRKGLPVSTGIAFLLAAPVLNPIVIFSTAAAFGWGKMLAWRLGLTLIIAVTVGIVFSAEKNISNILRLPLFENELPVLSVEHTHESIGEKLSRALIVSTDEFFEMGRYLILG
ncbi:MAG TPA: permease, partial [Anaerolineales bacterium]|nr:permease [Anaerolineales bacterium]